MTVSIIIAVKTWQKNLEECVAKCRELDFADFEIIILPDEAFSEKLIPGCFYGKIPAAKNPGQSIPVRIIPTGFTNPAKKRDTGSTQAKGDILAFLDDDAYPVSDWLKHAVVHFADPEVAAVGGPAVTPFDDSIMQKASGLTFSSSLVSGNFSYRYLPGPEQEVDDLPSCNLLIRRSCMQELGGFKTNFWPGEDTKLCLDIVKKLKKKIIYDPKVLVYHHRRTLFRAHLKQIANYALHRGYFVKKFPETSFKLPYFLPSIFLSGLVLGIFISILFPVFLILYILTLGFYLFMVWRSSSFAVAGEAVLHQRRLIGLVFAGIISSHLTYGLYFLKGLLAFGLKDES